MQQKLSTILVLLLLSTISGQARADYSWTYVAVSCDTASKEVTIHPSLLWNEHPALEWHGTIRPHGSDKVGRQTFRVTSTIDYGECVLFPGTLVRVKVSEGSTRPYGMCGADPEIWLSLWVGKYHWIKHRKIGGRCTTTPTSSVVVSAKGIKWCSIETYEIGQQPAGAKETCEFIPTSQLPRQRDLIEYPVFPQKRPEPGSIVIELGGGSSLCKSMVSQETNALGRAVWSVSIPTDAISDLVAETAHGLYEYAGHFSKGEFDIDNDGQAEIVYGFHPANHAHDADTYFVSPGGHIDSKWPWISDKMLWLESPYVFPNSNGSCGDHPCKQRDDDGLLTIESYPEEGRPFAYRFRHVHAVPFVCSGATYFLLRSLDSGTDHIAAVVKPQRLQPPKEMCVFRRVLNDY